MNAKDFFASAAAISLVALALPAHAQLLGGNVTGGLGGTLSGGLRNSDVLTRGAASGNLGADLEMDTTMRRAGRAVKGTTDTAVGSAQKASQKGRAAAQSAHGRTQDAAVGAKGSVAGVVSQAGGIAGSLDSTVTTSTSSTVSGARRAANKPVEHDEGGAPLLGKVTGTESASASGSLGQAAQLDMPTASETAETSQERGVSVRSSVAADASASASR